MKIVTRSETATEDIDLWIKGSVLHLRLICVLSRGANLWQKGWLPLFSENHKTEVGQKTPQKIKMQTGSKKEILK